MRDRLGAHPLPIQLPIGAGGRLHGVIDLVTRAGAASGTTSSAPSGRRRRSRPTWPTRRTRQRTHLIEACADYDDELMEAYLAEEEISPERIKAALRQATLDIKVTPVLCGSSFKNKGVQPLLDAVHRLPALAARRARR